MSVSSSVAVVILNWNGKKYLEKFLPFLLKTTYPHTHFIVADNGSSDDSVEFVRSSYPTVRILSSPVNEGFAKGYNTALKQVKADIFVLLNSDVEVTPEWIEPVVKLMESDPKIAACQPKILDWSKRTWFEYAGGAGGWIDRYGYPFCRGRIFDICEEDIGQYDHTEPIFWASGAAMFIRSDVFHQHKGFDEFFFAHQEEIDLCWRIQLSGFRIFACPQSVVYHVGGGTLPKGNAHKVFLNFRNNLIMLYKNYSQSEKVWKISYRLILDVISAMKNLFVGQTAYFKAVLRAHNAFFTWMFYHRSESVFPLTTEKKNLPGMYKGNVVWQHFLKGKTRFDEIIHPKK